MQLRRLIPLLGLVASLGACGGDDSTNPTPSTIPPGVTWELRCIGTPGNDTCYDPDHNQRYSIRFEDDGTVTGTNACNACNGTYSYVSATQIAIAWSCTEAACDTPPPWLGYGDAVGRTTSFALVNGGLVLRLLDRNGQPVELVHQPEVGR